MISVSAQPTQTTAFKPPLALKGPVFSGFNRVNAPTGDRVQFSSEAKTHAEIFKTTLDEAVSLFGDPANKDQEKLIAAVQKRFADSKYELHIYDGRKEDWVNDVCDAYNNVAFFQVPDYVQYGKPLTNPGGEGKYPEEYLKKVIPFLEQAPTAPGKTGRVAIYLGKGVDMTTLQHELFHALEFKNGLPFSTTQEADETAISFRNGLQKSYFSNKILKNTVDPLINLSKRLLSWTLEVPYALMKHLVTGGFWKKNETPTAGEALRASMRPELDVDKLFILHGGKFGAPMSARVAHFTHFIMESSLQYLRSYRLG
jgi:hypothetical protein